MSLSSLAEHRRCDSLVDAALSLAPDEHEVAVYAPPGPPAVLDQPVRLAARQPLVCPVTHQENGCTKGENTGREIRTSIYVLDIFVSEISVTSTGYLCLTFLCRHSVCHFCVEVYVPVSYLCGRSVWACWRIELYTFATTTTTTKAVAINIFS